ncbi:hypothetical protein NDU88_002147 [Pleurodeles waltl]|uniref:Reverse transcriptase domain-containing protein n=1 Tax=Pleurodeles waltl TaxID=8319 RepID=A0AAV7V9R6_PLEWA|nr:hypothetical protein NDU88_002147 [Pleurodeles waltl]
MLAWLLQWERPVLIIQILRGPSVEDFLGQLRVNSHRREHLQAIYATPCGVGVTRIWEYLSGLRLPRLTEAQSEELEAEVSLDDLVEALGGMASGKAPGPDGLPVEFYRTYPAVILLRLLEMLQEARGEGLLPENMREALIVMLPKPGKAADDPGSYRPLSMLNVDVKLLAKVLASRLSRVVTHLVQGDQCGFIPGRGTHMNIQRLTHILHETRDSTFPAALVALDMEKAFDTYPGNTYGR